MSTMFAPDDIVKISNDEKITLGRVVDSTETEVLVFRSEGNVWYSFSDWSVEKLGNLQK